MARGPCIGFIDGYYRFIGLSCSFTKSTFSDLFEDKSEITSTQRTLKAFFISKLKVSNLKEPPDF